MGSRRYDAVMRGLLQAVSTTHRTVDRVTGGRSGVRLPHGVHTIWLRHNGNRSGLPRRTPLLTVRDPVTGALVVMGSAGGQEREPAWSHNLRGHARRGDLASVEDGGRVAPVRVEVLTEGPEHERCLQLLARGWPWFRAYERRAHRVIPLFRLHSPTGAQDAH